ncbi:MAG TPA: S8 family serine peptidase [Woeseiaceae bacterium]|nr:S8 family serine peptidase [Woeseiaceae bacterium]
MNTLRLAALALACCAAGVACGEERLPDPALDILITVPSAGPPARSGGDGVPYRKRKRYAVSLGAQLLASRLAADYALQEIAHWPMRSLSVLCVVFRVAEGADRDEIIGQLRADARVDSAERLQRFETHARAAIAYDDPYASLQRGLELMGVPAAHRYSRGAGVRVAIVDTPADARHEDLQGRVTAVHDFTGRPDALDAEHGTAVASVIVANANNARGIVGVAPEAEIEVYAACWKETREDSAVCDSFTLAKALDSLAAASADVVNLSLSGPYDPLLERLLARIAGKGAVIVAARPADRARFPAGLVGIIGATSGDRARLVVPASTSGGIGRSDALHAPGDRIVVALPDDRYDFRSGSSLAAAHVSGAAALLLSGSPRLPPGAVLEYLRASERWSSGGIRSIDVCAALRLADPHRACP